jgi:uncharacterized protein
MIVVVSIFDLSIEYAQSLKEKRMVVKSLKDRLHNTFNVSANEVALQDVHQRARLAISFVAHDHAGADSMLEKLEHFIQSNTDAVLGMFNSEKLEFDEDVGL